MSVTHSKDIFCQKVTALYYQIFYIKVEIIQEDSLDLTPSGPPSVKIQIICGKVYLRG
jgi:hypothetical protein